MKHIAPAWDASLKSPSQGCLFKAHLFFRRRGPEEGLLILRLQMTPEAHYLVSTRESISKIFFNERKG